MQDEPNNLPQTIWRMELFGTFRAHRNGQPLEPFATQKIAGLLALLAFYPHRRHSREELIDVLWPDASPEAGRDRLSQALVWLRPRMEPDGVVRGSVLVTDRLSVRLNPDAFTSDTAEFEALLKTRRPEAMGQAVSLYQGDLLSGLHYDWVIQERQRLLTAYLAALHNLVQGYEAQGDFPNAVIYARRATTADPLDENAQGDLLRVLGAMGDTTAALRQFNEWKTLLARELNAEPSPATQAIVARIRQSETPPAPTTVLRAPGLPMPGTPFFGREDEIARICQLVTAEGVRLVTLMGTGGLGKTRLSLAVCATLAETYPDAMTFVPLTDLTDAAMLLPALATTLRVPTSTLLFLREQVVEKLSGRPYLLVLDNAEHLIEGTASLVRTLLEQVPTLTVLVTSRQRLGLEAEREVAVSSLPLPTATATRDELLNSVSGQLFVDRARAVRPDFAVTEANAEAIARICVRLEGIPLAIELCAAWAQTLTPAQMGEKLDRRFDLLVSRRRDIPARHRTLRAAVEYSYLQLPAELQRLFTYLSVFRGGWSLDSAGAVCEESDSLSLLSDLTELRERSLILAEEVGGEMRYRFLETLREFAGEQLTYAERTIRRRLHATYFLHWVEAEMSGPEQERRLTRLDRELENLRAALEWSLDTNEIEFGLQLADLLSRYWLVRGPLHEGDNWFRKLLDRSGSLPIAVEAKAWSTFGHLAWSQANYPDATTAHTKALEKRRASNDPEGIAESLYHLAITAYRQGDYDTCKTFLDESLTIAEARGDKVGISRVLLNLGNIAYERRQLAEADALFQQSLQIEQERGNKQRTSDVLNNMGLVAAVAEDYPKAIGLFKEALSLSRELANDSGTAVLLINLGTATRHLGDAERSLSLLNEGLKLAYRIGNKHITGHYLIQRGLLWLAEGNAEECVFLISAARHLFDVIGSSRQETPSKEEDERALEQAKAILSEPDYALQWKRGQSISPERLLSEILADAA